MHQSKRTVACACHESIWRVDCRKILNLVENSSSKRQRPRILLQNLRVITRPALLLVRAAAGGSAAAVLWRRMERLGTPCTHFPCYFLSLCACDFRPAQLFGGIGGGVEVRRFGKGRQLYGGSCKTDIVVFDKTGTLTKGVLM